MVVVAEVSPSIVCARVAAPSAVSSLPGPAAESSRESLGVVPRSHSDSLAATS